MPAADGRVFDQVELIFPGRPPEWAYFVGTGKCRIEFFVGTPVRIGGFRPLGRRQYLNPEPAETVPHQSRHYNQGSDKRECVPVVADFLRYTCSPGRQDQPPSSATGNSGSLDNAGQSAYDCK